MKLKRIEFEYEPIENKFKKVSYAFLLSESILTREEFTQEKDSLDTKIKEALKKSRVLIDEDEVENIFVSDILYIPKEPLIALKSLDLDYSPSFLQNKKVYMHSEHNQLQPLGTFTKITQRNGKKEEVYNLYQKLLSKHIKLDKEVISELEKFQNRLRY